MFIPVSPQNPVFVPGAFERPETAATATQTPIAPKPPEESDTENKSRPDSSPNEQQQRFIAKGKSRDIEDKSLSQSVVEGKISSGADEPDVTEGRKAKERAEAAFIQAREILTQSAEVAAKNYA